MWLRNGPGSPDGFPKVTDRDGHAAPFPFLSGILAWIIFSLFQFCLFLIVPEIVQAQIEPAYSRMPARVDFDQTIGMPAYVFRTYQFAAAIPGRVHVEVYIGMVNDILQFVKTSSDSADDVRYRAQYEVNIIILDKQKNVIDSRNWKRNLFADSFDATNDRKKLNLERATFDLVPGEYEIALEITDRDTGKHLREKRVLKLALGEEKRLHLSSIVFTQPFPAARLRGNDMTGEHSEADVLASWNGVSPAGLRDSLPYNLTATLTNLPVLTGQPKNSRLNEPLEKSADSLHAAATRMIGAGAYFEIYGASVGETLQLQYEILDWRRQSVQRWSENIRVVRTPVCHLAVLDDKIKMPGMYTFHLVVKRVEAGAIAGQKEATAEENFQVQIRSDQNLMASLAENKTLLFEPLRYVVKGAEYKRMAEASEAERDSLVAEFWRQRDPDPSNPANPLRDEFYRRVAFANLRFAVAATYKSGAKALSGWETDRG
ncbi:MAG: GWxTD domain-containing protein, partial [candidate division KSB1 bacterium]|nr:GWxTD domain-containing protein [candidate division KSB1 bacterium]MDZ7314219.1 GWxTD domain-containing protein [candidate division KSB1 bacterium]